MGRKYRGPRLEGRDQAIVRDMLRFRALATEHVARRVGDSCQKSIDTLERLTGLGFVRREPNWIRNTELWTATQLGARAVGSRRHVTALWPGGLPHDLALVDLADQRVFEQPHASWRTEREIMGDRARAARRGDPPRGSHRPDGLLIVDGRRIAIELELSIKTELDAYHRICLWYAEQVDVDGLRWYVNRGRTREWICEEIDRHGLDADLGIEIHPIPSSVLLRQWALP